MKGKFLRLTALLLAVLMLAMMFTACGGTPEEGNSGKEPAEGDNKGNSNGDMAYADFVYAAKYTPLKTDFRNIDRIIYANDKLYLYVWEITGKKTEYYDKDWKPVTDEEAIANGDYAESYEYDETVPAFYTMNMDGTNLVKLENYKQAELPEGVLGSSYINSLCIDPQGNMWLAEESYAYHYDDDGNYVDDGNSRSIRKLDETGAEVAKVDITKLAEGIDYFYINSIIADNDGALYISSDATVYVLDENAELSFKVTVDNWVSNLVRLKDGSVAVMTYAENGYVLKVIDKIKKDFGGKDITIPSNSGNMISGGGEYDFYYNDNINLYGYNVEAASATKIVNWIDSDINTNDMQSIVPLEDGRILAISNIWTDGETKYEFVTLTKTDPSTLPVKETLTFACMWLDYDMRAKIVEFNKKNEKYRINVVDYGSEDYTAGLLKLTTEIISGNVPDIIATSELPIQRYISRGLLEDLKPYIESDPELGLDSIVAGARKALEINGGIYQAASRFYVRSVVGKTSIVGDKMGWTMDDLNAAMANMPEGSEAFANMDRTSVLYYACMMNQTNYIDWTTGKCDFNNESFIKLLEFAKTFPVEIVWDEDSGYVSEYSKIMSGNVLLANTYLGDFTEFRVYKEVFGGDITYVGFPTDKGSGSVAYFNDGLAMSSTCKNKDAAWSFMRYLFTTEYQGGTEEESADGLVRSSRYYYWGFSTNQKSFDAQIKQAMEKQMGKDEDGNEIEISNGSWWIDDNTQIEMFAPTQEDIDQIIDLINNIDSAQTFDQSIYDIITEEAAAFFEGQKSAAEIANIIQSRVTIYVNEQM